MPHESILSSEETMTDPQNPLVDAMETYGGEELLHATGTRACECDCSTPQGTVGARVLSGDASVSL